MESTNRHVWITTGAKKNQNSKKIYICAWPEYRAKANNSKSIVWAVWQCLDMSVGVWLHV